MSKIVKICDYCENKDGDCCETCSHNEQVAGRELCIERMKEDKGIRDSAKLRNIVRASEIVLFKDLCRVLEVEPISIANKVTTNDIGKDALENHRNASDLESILSSFLTYKDIEELKSKKVFENIDYVYDCAGMIYGSSIHASGTLLFEGDLMLPIDAKTGDCHCNGDYAEKLGYIKYDLLSLNTLKPIESILGMNIDWDSFTEDRKMIESAAKDDLTFWFQFGSPIVERMIKGIDPKDLDIISLSEVTSINRPGPLNIKLNEIWVDRKNGNIPMKDEIDCFLAWLYENKKLKLDPHVGECKSDIIDDSKIEEMWNGLLDDSGEELKERVVDKIISLVLEKRYGLVDKLLIFQEDIMALCSYGAGFTLSEADNIRRAMGAKDEDLMNSFKDQFIKGWDKSVGPYPEEVWNKIADFAKYCFNKSHAIAYTMVSLATGSLQNNHFDDYMKWNYENLKTNMKDKAIDLMKEDSHMSYPTFRKPFDGISMGDSFLKSIEVPEDCETDFEYLSDLFLADIKPSIKVNLIFRGLYDPWARDIRGLAMLNKGIGKKNTHASQFPQTNNFTDFLDMLQLKKYIRYSDVGHSYRICCKMRKKVEDLVEEDFFYIGKEIMSIDKISRRYRVQSLIKEFGTCKPDAFSSYPTDLEEEYMDIIKKYEDIFDRARERNPDKKITTYDMRKVMRTAKTLYAVLERNMNKFDEYIGYVKSINVRKDGLCRIELGFSNESRMFYTRDEKIKVDLSKNDIDNFIISPGMYMGRDGKPKGVMNLKLSSR